MFMKICSRAAEYDESYDMAANCAEQLAQDVEKYLKIRGDLEMGNSCGTEGTPCTMTTKKGTPCTYNRLDDLQPRTNV
jgi:hypothetical protein